jgi:hypothetical protein
MAGRGGQSFKKRQKEQQRKERAEEKRSKRTQKKLGDPAALTDEDGNPIESDEEIDGLDETQEDAAVIAARAVGLDPSQI